MIYRIRKEIVARSFQRLRHQKTHNLFAGYLHLQQQASLRGQLNDLQPQFLDFFKQFFLVPGHPLGTPFLKPFELSPSEKNLWLNKNVAGTYAPSSLRPDQPFRKVVDIVRGVYTLHKDHAERARRFLLSEPVLVAELAVFLYRDYGLGQNSLTIFDLINIFAFEFGYSATEGSTLSKSFHILYSPASTDNWEKDWLEPI